MPDSKVKSNPLGSITPYYHSRKRSSCFFIIIKAPNVMCSRKSRLSVGVERSRTLLACATMAPDWTKLPGDGVAFLSLSLLFTFLGVCAISARTYTSWFCTKRFRLDYWLSLFTFVRCVTCDGQEQVLTICRPCFVSAKPFLSSVLFLVSERTPVGSVLRTSL